MDDLWRPWWEVPTGWNPAPAPTYTLRFAWICPRCSASNAPHVDRCACSPATTLIVTGTTLEFVDADFEMVPEVSGDDYARTCAGCVRRDACRGPMVSYELGCDVWTPCACGEHPCSPSDRGSVLMIGRIPTPHTCGGR